MNGQILVSMGELRRNYYNKVKEFYHPWMCSHQIIHLHARVNGIPNVTHEIFEEQKGIQKRNIYFDEQGIPCTPEEVSAVQQRIYDAQQSGPYPIYGNSEDSGSDGKRVYWGTPDWGSAQEGDQNSDSKGEGNFKVITKLPTPEGCLTVKKNDQLGTFASPSDTVESEASKSDVGPGSLDPAHQAPDGPGVQIKSEAEA